MGYINDLWPNFYPNGGAGLPRVGPFQHGLGIYIFFRHGYYIEAWKSADGGVSWAEVDAAHKPEWGDYDCYECVQQGSIIRVIYCPYPQPGQDDKLAIIDFDMGADSWGSMPANYGPAVGVASWGSTLGAALRSDGSLIVAYQDYGEAPDWDYRVRVVDWSATGGWGTPQTVMTSAVQNLYLLDAVLGPSDRFHIFGQLYGVLDTYHRSLSSSNVLGAQQTILSPVSSYSFSVRAIITPAGRLYLPYVPATDDALRAAFAESAENPIWDTEQVAGVMPVIRQKHSSVGGQIINGAPHFFWVKQALGAPYFADGLYYNRRNATWGADQLIEQDGIMPMPGLVAPSGAYIFWWVGASPEGWYYATLGAMGARYRVLP